MDPHRPPLPATMRPPRIPGRRDESSPLTLWGFHFNPGDPVEVVPDEPSLRGASFAPVLVGPSAMPRGGYTVEYEDSDRRLREALPAQSVRPPPLLPPASGWGASPPAGTQNWFPAGIQNSFLNPTIPTAAGWAPSLAHHTAQTHRYPFDLPHHRAPAVGLPAMASPSPAPPSASHRRRPRPPSPTASSVGSSPAFPPRKKRRSGRPPPLLGLTCYDGFYPAWEPHPSAKRALALVRKADFEYRFVPRVPQGGAWSQFPLDARDGRVLIQSNHLPSNRSKHFLDDFDDYFPDDLDDSDDPDGGIRFMNYAVCDPLFKRYVLLPPIPGHLTVAEGSLVNFGLCLAPSQEDEVDTSFRVICVARYETKLVVFVFSSVTRQWGIATSSNWSSLGTEEPPNLYGLGSFDYVDGCFYWTVLSPDKILVLDALKMELSVINYAHRVEDGFRACIAVDRKGTPGMLTVGEYLGKREFRLSRIAKQSDQEFPNERLWENIIELPDEHDEYFTLGAAEGFIFLRGIPKDDDDEEDPWWEPEEVEYYSLNVKTAEFERVCVMDRDKCYNRVCPYFRFSPPSAKPCV